jgi:hypothetical protein
MSKSRLVIAAIILALLSSAKSSEVAQVHAQSGDDCAAGFAAQVATLEELCATLPPGSLCTDAQGVAVSRTDGTNVSAGTGALAGVQQISTRGADGASQVPGISVLRVPALEAEIYLNAVLYGDAILANDPGLPQPPTCNARSIGTVNVRTAPDTESRIVGQLRVDQQVPVVGRLADATWWQIAWEGEPAWVFAELTPLDCDPASMLIADPASGEVSGGVPAPEFQGARLETSFATPVCDGLPRAGLLLQNVGGPATWRLNGELLRIDGTVLVQASTDDVLAIQSLEGQAEIQIGGITRPAVTGQLLRVPLRSGVAAGVPGPAVNYADTGVALAPVSLLPRQITLPAASGPAPTADEPITCDWLPRHLWVNPSDGQVTVTMPGEAGQSMRISAAGAGLSALAYSGPDGSGNQMEGEGPLVLEIPDTEAQTGDYRITAQTDAAEPIRVGVTCDLPRASAPQEVRDCADLLLRWDSVVGGSVRFRAPAGARVSVIADHLLPSQGAATTLSVLASDGQELGESGFVSFVDKRVAGPLAFDAPAETDYVVQWDGDPFNLANVEIICVLPAPGESAGD